MAEPIKTPLEPGLIARVAQGIRYIVTGASDAWMGPNQPTPPQADSPTDQTKGRAFDYRAGVNLDLRPKTPEGGIDFTILRGLADAYDLVRLCIETRKDQICAQDWTFKIKGNDKAIDPRLDELVAFFQTPDKVNDWEAWVRLLLEDLFVIDAPTVYPRLTRGGQPWSFEAVDGATIKRVVDGFGRTPMAPDPAYQQILKGIPAVDYTFDELIYRPRNMRTNKIYGFSPVEQIVTTVNIALRRQTHQLSYYIEGNIPDALMATPTDWTPDMVRQFQDWWDGVTTNTTKRKGRFIPGGTTFIDTKQSAMGPGEQVMNEWLARVVCFAFSISPTSLVASNNRATSDSQKEQAEDEGLKPAKRWLKRLIDYIVATYFGYPDLEFSWVTSKEIDALKQAQIDQIYLANKVVTADEVRVDNLGKEPLTDEQKEQISAANPAPVMMNPNADQNPDQEKPPNGEGPSGEGPKGSGSSKAETIHIHMPEIKTGDTLVEIGGTVVKVEQADGKVSEIRTDGRS